MTENKSNTTVVVTKVFDHGCPVCDTMSRFDKSMFEGFPEVSFQEIPFDTLRDFEGNTTRTRIYQCLERYAVSDTYEIDFPTYLFLSTTGKYLGFLQGALSLRELREGVKQILEQHTSE